MRSDQSKPILVMEDNADESFPLDRETLPEGGIKSDPLAKINRDGDARPLSSGSYCPSSECERLFEWAGLSGAHVQMNLACIGIRIKSKSCI